MGARHVGLSRALPGKSRSHSHVHSLAPVHFAMQQQGGGSDERLLLLAPSQFWGEAAAGGEVLHGHWHSHVPQHMG